MTYDIDPIDMTYCGKEFIDIVETRFGPQAICHLCQLTALNTDSLAQHLDGKKHYKNLRNFIMEKEYEKYGGKSKIEAQGKYPDFNAYMLSRYPSRLDEYFEKIMIVDPETLKTRTEYELKFKPAKMLLEKKAEKMKEAAVAAAEAAAVAEATKNGLTIKQYAHSVKKHKNNKNKNNKGETTTTTTTDEEHVYHVFHVPSTSTSEKQQQQQLQQLSECPFCH